MTAVAPVAASVDFEGASVGDQDPDFNTLTLPATWAQEDSVEVLELFPVDEDEPMDDDNHFKFRSLGGYFADADGVDDDDDFGFRGLSIQPKAAADAEEQQEQQEEAVRPIDPEEYQQQLDALLDEVFCLDEGSADAGSDDQDEDENEDDAWSSSDEDEEWSSEED
jgi:hypothetical protein